VGAQCRKNAILGRLRTFGRCKVRRFAHGLITAKLLAELAVSRRPWNRVTGNQGVAFAAAATGCPRKTEV